MHPTSPFLEEWNKNARLQLIKIEPHEQRNDYGKLLMYVYIEFMKKIGTCKIISSKKSYSKGLVKFYSYFDFDINNKDIVLTLE